MIITIDGPAGSGKSTAARGLARRLGFEYLDTGAMYRAVALAFLREFNHAETTEEQRAAFLKTLRLEMQPGRVLLDGEDVSAEIRTPQVTAAAAKTAALMDVRRFLIEQQRVIAAGRDIVCEGRDQGTVVFPNAMCKFYFAADLDERTRRRLKELEERGHRAEFMDVREEIRRRDEQDSSAETGRLPAPDAHHVDTTGKSPENVLDEMEAYFRLCVNSSKPYSTNSSTGPSAS